MQKVFIDANILVAVLNQDYSYVARVLSISDSNFYKIYTSPLCLAIAYYFSEKKNGSEVASKKIKLLSEKLEVTSIDANSVLNAINNPSIHNFEDGLEYYSALHSRCRYIVTENVADFYFSEI